MAMDTMVDMDWDTMARGMLMPRPKLIPTTMVDMASDTMARGMLSLRLRLMLILTTMEAMATVWAMDTMVDTAMDSMVDMDSDTMARGLLMPRPMLIPTTMEATMAMVWAMDMASMDMVMDMDMATTDKSSQPYLLHAQHQQGDLVIHQDLSVNHQLLCQHQMDYFSSSFIPHQCCQFQ